MENLNPSRGVVTKLTMTISYPDGTRKVETIVNEDDSLVSLVLNEGFAQRMVTAGVVEDELLTEWNRPTDWRQKHTAILSTRSREGKTRVTEQDIQNCLICMCGACHR